MFYFYIDYLSNILPFLPYARLARVQRYFFDTPAYLGLSTCQNMYVLLLVRGTNEMSGRNWNIMLSQPPFDGTLSTSKLSAHMY